MISSPSRYLKANHINEMSSILDIIARRLARKNYIFPCHDSVSLERKYIDFYDCHLIEDDQLKLIKIPQKGFGHVYGGNLKDIDTLIDWLISALRGMSRNFRELEIILLKKRKTELLERQNRIIEKYYLVTGSPKSTKRKSVPLTK